ncbi:uncharacterized protein LOC131076096 isoform X9 [Cryptomeria japonica]|uniref:uncharacterized protein LOC131076096 isoform X9 n=1 Tax=Cryptomeria japonica TaxID=3369 RepID=UPI0027D9D5AC|nr:uncharacterized protein LOC131076096 isoform X9 [Cryptomeria japonica]
MHLSLKHNYIAVRIRFLYVEIASAFLNTVLVRILISNWLHMSFIQIIGNWDYENTIMAHREMRLNYEEAALAQRYGHG